jgi:hypothetical protein
MKDILLVNEVFIKPFEFLRNDALSVGMQFRDEFFYHLATFNRKQQQQAFDLAWIMSRGGKLRVVVTAHDTQYKVWLGMRSPVSPVTPPVVKVFSGRSVTPETPKAPSLDPVPA